MTRTEASKTRSPNQPFLVLSCLFQTRVCGQTQAEADADHMRTEEEIDRALHGHLLTSQLERKHMPVSFLPVLSVSVPYTLIEA